MPSPNPNPTSSGSGTAPAGGGGANLSAPVLAGTTSATPTKTHHHHHHHDKTGSANTTTNHGGGGGGGGGGHQHSSNHQDPMTRSKLIQDDRWLNWSFFKGRIPTPKLSQLVKSFAVVAEPKIPTPHGLTTPPTPSAGTAGGKPGGFVFSATPPPLTPDFSLDAQAGGSMTNFGGSGAAGALAAGPGGWNYFVAPKDNLKVNAVVKLSHSGGRALQLCDCNMRIKSCSKAHAPKSKLTPISVVGNQSLFIHERGTLPFSVNPAEIEETAGLAYACHLMSTKLVKTCHASACNKFRSSHGCSAGPLCLYIHVKASQLPQSTIAPLLEATTSVEEAIGNPTVEMMQFIQKDLKEMGIKNLGDLQNMSPHMFEQLLNSQADTENAEFWLLLSTLRELPMVSSLAMTIIQFHGGAVFVDQLAAAGLPDVGTLCKLKPKAFYALKLPVQLLDICEKIRNRHDQAHQRNAYSTLRLDEKGHPWFVMMAKKVTEFKIHNAHKSWRKQDATRPIVTSAVTYVDPEHCKCRCNKVGAVPPSPSMNPRGVTSANRDRSGSQARGGSGSRNEGDFPATGGTESPMKGAQPESPQKGTSSWSREGTGGGGDNRSPGGGGPESAEMLPHAAGDSSTVPFAESWCQCPRQYELCVNYELSTPSGSRCSEQNCLGKLASNGMPTSCIREVFVHGGSHKNEDPNPLFPCGVCENMFRRVSKDVGKEHDGADVMLYMFDQEEKPKKLVCLPVTEISHRAGAVFKQFVEEEVKDDE